MRAPAALLALLLPLAACGSPDPAGPAPAGSTRPLRFTAIPDQDTARLREKFDPVARYLQGALGVPVEYVPMADYPASVEAFRSGDVQLAWFGGLTGVQARHLVPGARAIAQGEEDPQFVSYFVAHKDVGLSLSEEFPMGLEGKTFSFGSKSSTSGRLMPEYFLRERTGRAPEAFFGSVTFSGDHDKTAELVAAGRVQAGVLNYKVYEQRVKEGKTDPATVVVVWKTPPYPDYNFTAHPSLDATHGAGFVDRLQQALLDMKDPALLAAFPRKSLIRAANEDFEPTRRVAEQLGLLPK